MLAVSEVLGLDDPAGGLAGIVVLTRYGTRLAAIGMMVVASRYGRRGLGRRLMQHALSLAGDAVVYLTATDYGRPLYARLGFRAVDSSTTHVGAFRLAEGADGAGPAGGCRPVTPVDLPRILALDREVFGADRGHVLAEMLSFGDAFLMRADPLRGYAAAWINEGKLVVGPIVAGDQASAAELIISLAAGWPGQLRLDILGRHAGLARWATASGLAPGHVTSLMVYGGELPGDRARLFGPVTVAIG